jgi:peptide-methionine (S)-S-oxide reductase
MERAIFAAGCFWGVEANFKKVEGVIDTTVGYIGGKTANPSYEEVCTGETGHAEAVKVNYDPQQISYLDLLDFFWSNHDPTTLNREGVDIGSQYRSAIFYTTPQQQQLAQQSKQKLDNSGEYEQPIVTEIVAATDFYKAEEYHQDYFDKH